MLINGIEINKLKETLMSNQGFHLFSSIHNQSNVYVAIEEYIIRYYNTFDVKEKAKADKFIDKIFTAFEKIPYAVSYSKILNDKRYLNKFCKDNKGRTNKYRNATNILTTTARKAYQKYKDNISLTEDETNCLYAYATKLLLLKDNNKDHQNMINILAKDIIKENIQSTNSLIKLFIVNYVSLKTLEKYGHGNATPANIRLVRIAKDSRGYIAGMEAEGNIDLNINPISTSFSINLDTMITSAIHETIHYIQELEKTNINSYCGFAMIIQKILNSENYKLGKNYSYNEIEEDANKRAFEGTKEIYLSVGREDIYNRILRKESIFFDNIAFQYEHVLTSEKPKKIIVNKEKYNTEGLMNAIQKNPKLLSDYPVLMNIFNKNADIKKLKELLLIASTNPELNKICKDAIIYKINNNELDGIDLSTMEESQKIRIIKTLNDIISSETKLLLDILNDIKKNSGKEKKEIIKMSFEYRIKNVMNIVKKIETEFDFMNKYNIQLDYSKSFNSLISLLNYLKTNRKLGTVEKIYNTYEYDINKSNQLLRFSYVENMIKQFTTSELSTYICFDKTICTIREFILKYVRKNMDLDYYMHYKNGENIVNVNNELIRANVEFVRYIMENCNILKMAKENEKEPEDIKTR